MKKMIIAIMLVFCATTVRAENTNISTSQYYVDTNAATRQDAVPANNANSVMTYDSTSPDGIGAKAIYDTTAAYETQTNALVTAATANAAIQNGINSEFVCANPPKCNLWDLKGFYPTNLPAGYTELEYIESTGIYLNTNTVASTNMSLDAEFELGSVEHGAMFGARDANVVGVGLNFGIDITGKLVLDFFDGTRWITDENPRTGVLYRITINNNVAVLYKNGTQIATHTFNNTTPQTTTNEIVLFGLNNAGVSVSVAYSIQMHKFIISNSLNLIPVKNSSGIIGTYDTVTNTFFTNQGTGNFIAGPAVSYIPQNQ